MKAEQVILSRGLPKTGQVTSYTTTDDGAVQAGWWKGRTIANNKTRFVAKTIDGDDVVIDLATGLMWAADGNEAGCFNGFPRNWELAVACGETLDFAGFTDWRLPNIQELHSILDFNLNEPTIKQPPFANTKATRYWTSTTVKVSTSNALYVEFDFGASSYQSKPTPNYTRCVRGGV